MSTYFRCGSYVCVEGEGAAPPSVQGSIFDSQITCTYVTGCLLFFFFFCTYTTLIALLYWERPEGAFVVPSCGDQTVWKKSCSLHSSDEERVCVSTLVATYRKRMPSQHILTFLPFVRICALVQCIHCKFWLYTKCCQSMYM